MSEDAFEGELWVRGHNGERGVLRGNPHTHPGRFSVLWESTGETHATSLSELADMSDQSRAWLAGFLSGNEPEPFQVLGLDIDDVVTDEQYEVWRGKLAEFRETGWMRLPIPGEDDGSDPGEIWSGVDLSSVSMWRIELIIETDDLAEVERVSEAVAQVACPTTDAAIPPDHVFEIPWMTVTSPLEGDEAERWRQTLNR